MQKIEFEVNNDKLATYNGKLYIEASEEFFNALKGLDVNMTVLASEFIGEQVLVFEDVNLVLSLDFLLNEMLFTSNNLMKDMFLPEE